MTDTLTPEQLGEIDSDITAYLSGGGLFNPELANHDAVRDLILRTRKLLAHIRAMDEQIATIQERLEQKTEFIKYMTTLGIPLDVWMAEKETRIKELEARSNAKWQPIGTAPKDDLDEFLVGRSRSAGVEAVFAAVRLNGEIVSKDAFMAIKEPTHWKPLPEPPQEQS